MYVGMNTCIFWNLWNFSRLQETANMKTAQKSASEYTSVCW